MKSAHDITGNDTTSFALSSNVMFQSMLSSKPVFPEFVLRKYQNVVVDYVVEGGVTLRVVGDVRFKNLDVAISLTLDDWSNHNLKGFYVIIAHWVDVVSLTDKGIFMAILDVKCETSVSKRVGAALFEYLKRLGRDVMTRLLNVVSDNGLDVTTIVARLFQLVNTFIGYEHMREVNHVRCADHSVQLVVLNVLTFIKEPTEQLWDALITIPCGRSESPVADHKSTLDLVPMSVTHS
ncbi:unnamed protein product [Sphagnum tenellum]